ncbi:unnamed protein product [Closterium sp. NIES-64]|nr:unnamed protein product [Closterium sp. NIES-64]
MDDPRGSRVSLSAGPPVSRSEGLLVAPVAPSPSRPSALSVRHALRALPVRRAPAACRPVPSRVACLAPFRHDRSSSSAQLRTTHLVL